MKTLYLYWGGRKLSWLRYLTVVSFKKHNPDWNIKVYYPTHPTVGNAWNTDEQIVKYLGEDWFDKLPAEKIPFDMSEVGLSNDLAEVHKSDIFRLWALEKYGGVYSDFDILYTKPMPVPKERWFCRHPDGHYAIGLLAAKKGDGIYRWLLESVKLRTDTGKYQSYGSTLWNAMLDDSIEGWNIPKNLIYSVDWQDADKLFTESKPLPKDSIGIHWYGGSKVSGQWENKPLKPSTIKNITKELE